jgi:hypothetical protein
LARHAMYRLNPNCVTTVKQVDSDRIHWICRGSYMVVSHINSTQEKWQIENLYKFLKTKCSHKEGSIPITFYIWSVEHNSRVWSIFFLRRIFKISSNLLVIEDKYKTTFVID